MAKIKVCLAVANESAEEYLQEKILNRDPSVIFTEPALHREAVLDRVTYDMPSVLIISESLPEGGSKLSFDAVITTIRTKFTGCRIILLAGDHGVGDPFLNKMVSRGVYDIVAGLNVQLDDVVDCVFVRKTYDYAAKLQGLEVTPHDEEDKSSVSIVKTVEEEKRRLFGKKQQPAAPARSNTLENQSKKTEPAKPVSEPNYDTSILKTPSPSIEDDDRSFDTTILTGPQETPRGIIFERVGSQPSSQTTPQSPAPEPKAQVAPEKKENKKVSSHIVSNSKILTKHDNKQNSSEENKPIIPVNRFLPKIVLFFGARQGVGCTTSLINTAFTLARKGKRVAVIDAVWNEKSIFDKLRIPHVDKGFNNNENKPLPKGFVSSFAVDVQTKEGSGYIQFLELVTSGEMPEGILSVIRALAVYNYIFIDMSIAYYNPFAVGLINLADSKVAVVTQDSYEFMVLKNYLNAYGDKVPQIFDNLSILITKGENVPPRKEDARTYFGKNIPVYMIPADNAGFINASTRPDGLYINNGKYKVIKRIKEFAESLE